jgi:hypothetical protein
MLLPAIHASKLSWPTAARASAGFSVSAEGASGPSVGFCAIFANASRNRAWRRASTPVWDESRGEGREDIEFMVILTDR